MKCVYTINNNGLNVHVATRIDFIIWGDIKMEND